MKISTINNKAKNLIFLKNKGFNIPKLIIFNFINKNELIINKIQKNFRDKIAIRSSAKNEDGLKFSNAGKYESFVNIDTKKKNY